MVDEIVSTPVSAPAVATLEAPISTPVVSPVAVESAAPTSVETPSVTAVEAPVTLLAEGLDKTTTPTPVEAPKPPVEATAEAPAVPEPIQEEGQSEEPAPPPSFEAFTLPENVQMDNERMSKFTGILAELETSGKIDHTLVQQFGQKAIDLYINEVTKNTEDYTKYLQDSWARQKNEWKESFLKDPEIGGNRFQTTVDSALTFIRTHGGSADQQTEFRNLMESSGLGNHPALIRLLANAGRAMSEGTPLAAQRPVSAPKSKTQTLYGAKS